MERYEVLKTRSDVLARIFEELKINRQVNGKTLLGAAYLTRKDCVEILNKIRALTSKQR